MSEPAVGVEAPRRRADHGAALREWLASPLLVAVVSTLLVSLVIPRLTRDWQDHQKELEVQTSLVGAMSSSASDAVIAGRMLVSGLYEGKEWQDSYNEAIRRWSVDGSIAGSKLEAYFPGSQVAERWRRYVTDVTNYLVVAGPSASRRAQVEQLRESFPSLQIDWDALLRGDPIPYTVLSYVLARERDDLVRAVLADHPSGF